MNWLHVLALIGAGYAVGRLQGRRRTRADLARLGDLINAAIPFDRERRLAAELDEAKREEPPHA